MSPETLTRALKEEAVRLGFELAGACPAVAPPGIEHFRKWLAVGFAGRMEYLPRRAAAYEHPQHVLAGARSLLVLGKVYRTVEPATPGPGQGRVSRYAWGRDYHEVIRRRLRRLADFHRRLTPQAHVRGVVDTAPLLEKEFARLAGLGWLGKNTLLLNRRHGSWFFLAVLLTTAELAYDVPVETDHCGTCRACLDACPTGALVAPRQLDARRCISYLTIELRDQVPEPLRPAIDNWVFGCDVCQEVCPWNRRASTTDEEAFYPQAGTNPLNLPELLRLDETGFRQRFRHSPLWRPRRRGVLQAAALALGNRPVPEAVPALVAGLNDPEPLVRGASAWALGRYNTPAGANALQARLATETVPAVQAEIRSALAAQRSAGWPCGGDTAGSARGGDRAPGSSARPPQDQPAPDKCTRLTAPPRHQKPAHPVDGSVDRS